MLDFRAPVFVVCAFFGPVLCDVYNVTKGGTKLYNVPNQILVVISPTATSPEQKPDCVAVFIGGFNQERDQGIALTSPYCEINQRAEVRTARQETISAKRVHYGSDEFQIGIIQLDFQSGYWKPELATVEWEESEFRRELIKGGKDRTVIGYGFAANTNPILAYTVSFNQTGCGNLFKEFRKPSWPIELPEGGFCVFRGGDAGFPGHVPFFIQPATPCMDGMGSPVLYDDFTKVLGIIIWTVCEAKTVAFAISPAFLPDIVVPSTPPTTLQTTTTTTTTTELPPPLPRVPHTSRPCADALSAGVSCHPRLSSVIILCGLGGIRW